MTNINGIQPPVSAQHVQSVRSVAANQPTASAAKVTDVVDISNVARLTAKVAEIPDVRADLVARVKAEIANGTYETPERLEIAVDRLMDELIG